MLAIKLTQRIYLTPFLNTTKNKYPLLCLMRDHSAGMSDDSLIDSLMAIIFAIIFAIIRLSVRVRF